jgi:FAD/FMN-containing dehydrogenase
MDGYLSELRARLAEAWPGYRCIVFGHLGDGNLHISVSVGAGDPETTRRVEEMVYGALQSRGGSVSAEHGIGMMKRPYLGHSRTDAELSVMRALKRMLDPADILNRGRVLLPEKD